MNDKIEKDGVSTKTFTVTLTESDKLQVAARASSIYQEIERQELELKSEVTTRKAKINSLTSEYKEQMAKLATGKEQRLFSVKTVLDYIRNKKIFLEATTGQELGTAELEYDDYQLKLNLETSTTNKDDNGQVENPESEKDFDKDFDQGAVVDFEKAPAVDDALVPKITRKKKVKTEAKPEPEPQPEPEPEPEPQPQPQPQPEQTPNHEPKPEKIDLLPDPKEESKIKKLPSTKGTIFEDFESINEEKPIKEDFGFEEFQEQ